MAHPARPIEPPEDSGASAALSPIPLPPGLPVILNVRELVASDLRYVDASATAADAPAAETGLARKNKKETLGEGVLRGIKDLQDLQKQTIAVLEAVKGTLDDIGQVLRSPEATRGMEKQRNAAMLLAKGFVREAVEQAQGAAVLLPANPEAHLLLSLSLAADQQFEQSLAAARKGLALFDRRSHPLAIEAGLLHALAALGCGAEAVERWGAIVDSLPLPVIFEQLARIAACFPAQAAGGGPALLDEMLNRRLARDEQHQTSESSTPRRPRLGKIDLRPDEIPAGTVFAGLDAAHDYALPNAHRAILGHVARRLQFVRDSADVVQFLAECAIPLGNRGLEKSAEALGRAAVKRLFRFHADAMTLHRAMGKLEMANCQAGCREIAMLLNAWRIAGNKVARAKGMLACSGALLLAGLGGFVYVLFGQRAFFGATPVMTVASHAIPTVFIGPGVMALGAVVGLAGLMRRTWDIPRPFGRPALSPEERSYLNTADVRSSIKGVLQAGAA